MSAKLGEILVRENLITSQQLRETLEYQRDRGMGVTVYRGKRKGSASTADLSERAIRETVAKAVSIAGFTAEDPCAGLPEPDTIAKHILDLDLCHPWTIDPEQARDPILEVRGERDQQLRLLQSRQCRGIDARGCQARGERSIGVSEPCHERGIHAAKSRAGIQVLKGQSEIGFEH